MNNILYSITHFALHCVNYETGLHLLKKCTNPLVASWVAEDFDFAKIISSDKNIGVVGTSTGVDICTICSLRPDAQGVESECTGVGCPLCVSHLWCLHNLSTQASIPCSRWTHPSDLQRYMCHTFSVLNSYLDCFYSCMWLFKYLQKSTCNN